MNFDDKFGLFHHRQIKQCDFPPTVTMHGDFHSVNLAVSNFLASKKTDWFGCMCYKGVFVAEIIEMSQTGNIQRSALGEKYLVWKKKMILPLKI